MIRQSFEADILFLEKLIIDSALINCKPCEKILFEGFFEFFSENSPDFQACNSDSLWRLLRLSLISIFVGQFLKIFAVGACNCFTTPMKISTHNTYERWYNYRRWISESDWIIGLRELDNIIIRRIARGPVRSRIYLYRIFFHSRD